MTWLFGIAALAVLGLAWEIGYQHGMRVGLDLARTIQANTTEEQRQWVEARAKLDRLPVCAANDKEAAKLAMIINKGQI